MRQILRSKPSARELSRYAELVDAARGRLSSSSKGDVVVDGELPLEGTSFVSILQYLTKGARGPSKPAGVGVVGRILQEGNVRSSIFSPTVIPLLGGKSSRAGQQTQAVRRGRSAGASATPNSPRMLPPVPP